MEQKNRNRIEKYVFAVAVIALGYLFALNGRYEIVRVPDKIYSIIYSYEKKGYAVMVTDKWKKEVFVIEGPWPFEKKNE